MKYILFGAGAAGLRTMHVIGEEKVKCFADNRIAGKEIEGKKIISFDEMIKLARNYQIVITTYDYVSEMSLQLQNAGITDFIIAKETFLYDSEFYLNHCIQEINRAYNMYEKLSLKYNDSIFLIAPKASGDLYFALAFLDEWKTRNNIKNTVVIGCSENAVGILELYEINDFEIITPYESELLIKLYQVFCENLPIKLISPWQLKVRNSFFPTRENQIIFADKFRYETFGLDANPVPKFPEIKTLEKKESNHIILSPYAYSSPAPRLSTNFWIELAHELIQKGYDVLTVGYGKNEPAIIGSALIRFSYSEAGKILNGCSGFIASRSGLCDIVHSAKCRQTILFSNNIVPAASHLYSMKLNFPDFTGNEILCDDYNENELLEIILSFY